MLNFFSKTLDKKGSLEMGLKLDKMLGSRFVFLRSDWTVACLNEEGEQPVQRQQFMMDRMLRPTVSIVSFSMEDGR